MTRRQPADLNVVAAFYKRWEPYEAQRRDIAADLKELFAEAKADGLNPKSLRAAFADFYRIENQTADEAEKHAVNDSDRELYLSALARVREGDEEFDPETGEIPETLKPSNIRFRRTEATSQHDAESAEGETQVATVRAASSANSSTAARKDVPLTTPADGSADSLTAEPINAVTHLREGTGPLGAGTQAPPVETHSKPAEGNTPTSAGHGDWGAVVPSVAPVVAANVVAIRTHNPETHFLNSEGLQRLHGCLKPELCGSPEPRKRLCFDCSRLHDGPAHQDGAA